MFSPLAFQLRNPFPKNGRGMALISVMLLIALIAIVIAILAGVMNTEIMSTASRRDTEVARQNAMYGLQMAISQLQEEAGPDQRVTARAEILNSANDPGGTAVVPSGTGTPVGLAAAGNSLWTGVWKTASNQDLDTAGGMREWSYRSEKPKWLVSAPVGTTPDPKVALTGTNTVTMAKYRQADGSDATVKAYLVPVGKGTPSNGDYAYWVSDEGVKAKANITNPWAQTSTEASGGDKPTWLRNQLSFMMPQRTAIEKMTLLSDYPSTKEQRAVAGKSPLLATDWASFFGVMGLSGDAAKNAKLQHFADITFHGAGVLADARRGGLKTDLSAGFADPTWKVTKMDGVFEEGNFLGPAWNSLKSYGNIWQEQWWDTDPLDERAQIIPSPEGHSIFSMRSQLGGAAGNIQPFSKTEREKSATNDPTASTYWFPRQDLTSLPIAVSMLLGLEAISTNPGDENAPYKLYLVIYPEIVLWNPYNVSVRSGSWVAREGPTFFQGLGTALSKSAQIEIHLKKKGDGPNIFVGGKRMYYHPEFPNFKASSGADPISPDDCLIRQTIDMGFQTAGDIIMGPGEVRRFGLSQTQDWDATTSGFWVGSTFSANYPAVTLNPNNNADSRVRLPLQTFKYRDTETNTDKDVVFEKGDSLTIDMGMSVNGRDYELSLDIPAYAGAKAGRTTKYPGSGSLGTGKLFFSGTYGTGDYLPPSVNATGNRRAKGMRVASPIVSFPTGSHTMFVEDLMNGVKFTGFRLQAKTAKTSRGNAGPVFSQTSFRRNTDDYAPNYLRPANVGGTGGFQEYHSINMETYGVKAINQVLAEGDIFSDVDSDLNGYSYFGNGFSQGTGGASKLVMFDIPRQPLLSLGALMHANLNLLVWDPTYAIGGSLPNLLIPRSQKNLTISGASGDTPVTIPDLSFYMNESLFDGYFFSSVPVNSQSTLYPPFASFDETYIANDRPLPNGRMIYRRKSGEQPKIANLRDKSRAAGSLMVDGAFNINSTSVEAWKAQLGALSGQAMVLTEADGTRGLQDAASMGNPLPRSTNTVGEISGGDDDNWTGGRSLTDSQIAALAQSIVDQVKARGPFLGMADFVNRRLGSDNDFRTASGALEKALANTKVNDQVNTIGSSVGNIIKTSNTFDKGAKGYTVNLDGNKEAGAGQPSWLMQNDILKSLTPILSARSDTFVVRCLGEKKSPSGKVVSRAWCEAVVQRMPEYVNNTADRPETPITMLTNADNQKFGRRFEVVSFRWMHPSEVQ